MTVSSIVPVNNYTGNSSNKKFDFDFLIEDEGELVVQHINENGVITTLTLGVDYSINEIGNEEGSYITFPLDNSSYSVLSKDETISLMLSLVIKQESEFRNSSYFDFTVLEWTFDYIVRILQIMNRQIERAAKVAEGSDDTDTDNLVINLNNIAANLSVIQAVNNNEADIDTAAENISDINTTAENISDINTCADNITVINAVYNNETNINTAAENISDINTCAENIEDIQNAAENAQTAVEKAAAASKYADNAQIWAEGTDVEVAALGGEHSSKVWAEQATDGADIGLTNLSDIGENKLEAQKGYYTGNVLTDSKEYLQLLDMAHSTYDSSKFTTYGSPSVSDNGIISYTGSSSLSYVRASFGDLTESDNWDIYFDYTTGESTASSSQTNIIAGYQNVFSIYITANASFSAYTYYQYEDENWAAVNVGGNTYEKLAANTHYFLKYHYDSTTGYTLYWRTEDESWSIYGTNEDTTKTTVTNGYNLIGYGFTTDGQIDLKRYKVISEGSVVFDGTQSGTDTVTIAGESAAIPYTLSSTGSKIVDAEYRELVQALYEQDGKALYYTLNETNNNFTLPMGEIYGMMKSYIDESIAETAETINESIEENVETINKTFLPLSGGTMTGGITSNRNKAGTSIFKTTNISDGTFADIQFYSDSSKRVATVRATNYDGYNTLMLGAHDESDSAPAGLMVTNTDGTVTITGITPSNNDDSTQLATTAFVSNMLTGSNSNFIQFGNTTTGYIRFASGFTIQWGNITTSGTTITLPLSMTGTAYTILLGSYGSSLSGNQSGTWSSKTTTGFYLQFGACSGLAWTVVGF